MNSVNHCCHYQFLILSFLYYYFKLLSELKSVVEIAKLSFNLDSEVLQSEFDILMAKSMIFWTLISTVPDTNNTVNERWSSIYASIGNFILEKLGGHKSAKPCEI